MDLILTPELLLSAYEQGFFPMAEDAKTQRIGWFKPEMRGQLSIDQIHIPRSLKKAIKKGGYTITINQDFESVITECGRATDDRPLTWINDTIRSAFIRLHRLGHAHSVEYRRDGQLMGGLYGLAIGGVFCGESMFSRDTNASKIALIHLCARLWAGGFQILDTQFTNDHLEQFGIYEVPHHDYLETLKVTIPLETDFILPDQSEADILEQYFKFREHSH